MNNTLYIFKIRNKETGLFSAGSKNGSVSWSKNGKAWNEISHLKSSITQLVKFGRREFPYHNSEVVVYKIEVDDVFDVDSLT